MYLCMRIVCVIVCVCVCVFHNIRATHTQTHKHTHTHTQTHTDLYCPNLGNGYRAVASQQAIQWCVCVLCVCVCVFASHIFLFACSFCPYARSYTKEYNQHLVVAI